MLITFDLSFLVIVLEYTNMRALFYSKVNLDQISQRADVVLSIHCSVSLIQVPPQSIHACSVPACNELILTISARLKNNFFIIFLQKFDINKTPTSPKKFGIWRNNLNHIINL